MGKFLFPIHKVLAFTLVSPLFIQVFKILGIGLHLNVLLLFILIASMFAGVLFNYANIRFSKISISFLAFFILSLIQIITFSRVLPVLFFLYASLITLFIYYDKVQNIISENRKVIYVVTVTYVGVSLLLLLLHINFDPTINRFYGLAYTPTTFVIYLIVLLILFHYVYKSSITYYILFSTALALTYFSGTRTGLLLMLLLPVNNYFYDRYLKSRVILRVLIFAFIMGIYPLADFISLNYPELVEYRIGGNEGEIDYSYATRIEFTFVLASEWLNGDWVKTIFGFGTEFCRLTILDLYNEDQQLHNDFLKFVIDFGFPMALIFFYIIFSLSRNNKHSFFLAIIYLFSCYHNMVYELMLFNSLLFLSKAKSD